MSTTGRKTLEQEASGSTISPDDPIFKRGFVIGETNTMPSSPSTTHDEEAPAPKTKEPQGKTPHQYPWAD